MKRILFVVAGLAGLVGQAAAQVDFQVTVNRPAKNFGVAMTIQNANETEKVRIPNWCPGFYFLLDYAKRISSVRAFDPTGVALRVSRTNDDSYIVSNPAKTPVRVLYNVSGNDSGLGFFRSHVRDTSAFINGPAVFMYAEGRKNEKQTVTFKLPDGWDVATAMDEDAPRTFSAPEYDELLDHPIQLGNMVRKSFEVEGIPFEAIWVTDAGIRCDITAETERLRLGSIPAIKMFGGAPFKKYKYIVHLEIGDFAGGLEHRSSTVIAVANSDIVHLDTLATHEFFHSWNVKQIRPQVLGPFDYTKQVRTANLWFAEGVTDYYAKVHAYQGGLLTPTQYLQALEQDIEDLQSSTNRSKMTIEEVSKNCWEHGGFGVGDLSYYTKGCLIGFVLDAELRATSKGKKTLDDLMRKLMDDHALPKPGYSEDQLRAELVAFGGEKFGPLYDSLVRSKDEVKFDLLTGIGLRLAVPGKKYWKLPFTQTIGGTVTGTPQDSQRADIRIGDAVQSVRANEKTGDAVVVLTRNSKKLEVPIKLIPFTAGDYRLEINPFATDEQIDRRKEWLAIPK